MADFPDPPRHPDEPVDDNVGALLEPPPRPRRRIGIVAAVLALVAAGAGAYW
jgi:hypothetical protein